MSKSRAARDYTHGAISQRAERTVGWGALVSVAVVLVTVVVAWVWPVLSFLWSPARTAVDALYSSSVYVSDDAPAVDRDGLEGIIGTRPIVVLVLAGDDSLADSPRETCGEVSERLPDVLVQVVVDGESTYGCEGDEFTDLLTTDWFGWDFRFWLQHGYATTLVTGDVPEITRSLALAYDAEVQGGRLDASTRQFGSPPHRAWVAAILVGGVSLGSIGLFFLLRWGIRRAFASADSARAWHDARDQLDAELGEIALAMLAVDPSSVGDQSAARAVGQVAADYRWVLQQLERLTPGEPLDVLSERVGSVRKRLADAGVMA